MNRAEFIGRLTRDPQRGSTANVVNFDIACDRRLSNGERAVDYVHCAAWEKLGEIAEKYLKKGMMVFVDGRVSARAYEGRDGSKRASLDLSVNNLQMLSSKKEMEAIAAANASAETDSDGFTEVDDDELPF